MKIREVQYKEFNNLKDYYDFHNNNYQSMNGIKETGLWINENNEVHVEYINVILN